MTLSPFLALIGRKKEKGVEQAAAIVWRAAEPQLALEDALIKRVEKTPDPYVSACSPGSIDGAALRIGVIRAGSDSAAYIGQQGFTRIHGNSRGLTPFGVVLACPIKSNTWRFSQECLLEIKRLFDWYCHDFVAGGQVIHPVNYLTQTTIADLWQPSTGRVFEEYSRELGQSESSDTTFREYGSFFIISSALDASARLNYIHRISALFRERATFDAFLAINEPLEKAIGTQALSGLIGLRTIDEVEQMMAGEQLEPAPEETNASLFEERVSAPEFVLPIPPPVDAISPPLDKFNPTENAGQGDLGEIANLLRLMEAHLGKMAGENYADGAAAARYRLQHKSKRWGASVLAAAAFVGMGGVIWQLYGERAPLESDTHQQAATENLARIGECKNEVNTNLRAYSDSDNPVLKIIASKAAAKLQDSSDGKIEKLNIDAPDELLAEIRRIDYAALEECLRN